MPLNDKILNSPISLFLGAGASQPLGKPTMQPFVQSLPNKLDTGYHKLLEYFVAKCGDDLEQLLAELDSILNLRSSDEVYAFYSGSQQNLSKRAAGLRYAIE